MNPRIAKDIQLVKLPVITGIVLMIGASILVPSVDTVIWMIVCAIIVPAVYVSDLVPNGLPLALTLPVPRSQLWREKTWVAGIALLVISLINLISYLVSYLAWQRQMVTPLIDVLFMVSLPIFFLGAGAVIALSVRQTIATFWLLLLAGGGLFVFCAIALPWLVPEVNIFLVLNALFVVGGVAGVWKAGRQFREFEDDGSHAALGHIEFGTATGAAANRRRHAGRLGKILILAKKEIILQQINVVLTIGVVLVTGAMALTVPMDYLMMIVWLPRLIALLIAFVVGAVAFAEEERMGLASWALTFPANRRTQFQVKLAVALVGGIALALIGMVSMDALVSVRAIANQFTPVYELRPVHFIQLGLLAPMGACLGGAFTSSFCRSFLAALSHSLLTGMVLFGLYLWFNSFLLWLVPIEFRVPPDALLLITAGPALIFVLAWCSWRNFVRESTRSKAVTSYVTLATVIVAVMLFDAAVFLRAWEWLEASPSEARFAKASTGEYRRLSTPIITGQGSYAIDRDGSLWRTHHIDGNPGIGLVEREPYRIGKDNDWVDVVGCGWRGSGMFALKSDGSLWMQGEFNVRNLRFTPEGGEQTWYQELGWVAISVSSPRSIARGSKWKSLQQGLWSGETFAIRDDGTLWMWGQPDTNTFRVDIDGPVQMTQLSADTDWKQVVGRFALKEDGSLWVLDGNTYQNLGFGTDDFVWGPKQAPLEERFSELIAASRRNWPAVIGRTTEGEALLLGYPYSLLEWQVGCPEAQGIAIRPINLADAESPWFRSPEFVLTDEGTVLARRPQVDIGCSWLALNPLGGFTIDGSYWHLHREQWGVSSGVHRIAEWLHLSLREDEVRRLFPPRWRPQLVGKLGGDSR